MSKNLHYIAVVFFLGTFLCLSQNSFKFGNATASELSMKVYEKDSTANAVVLYEYGEALIGKNRDNDVELTFEYTVRIKIFNSNAFDKATIEIPLSKSLTSKRKEKLIEATAISISPDRTTNTLKKSDIFTENVNEYYDLVKFTMPNIQEGTIIDYTYKISSPFHFNFVDWEFQSDIPKVFSQFHTSIPGNYFYNIKLVGTQKLTNRESKIKKDCLYYTSTARAECAVETYTMENIPAFKEEDYMTAKINYLSAIRYELETFKDFRGNVDKYTKSWKDVDKEFKFGDGPGKESRRSSYFKDYISADLIEMPNAVEKAKKIYYQLQKELFWNKKNSIHRNVDVKEAYQKKSGSTAELNLILQNFLNASGFDAKFMLLSTRGNGIPTKLYPIISEFNYLVIKLDIGGTTYLLDITNKNTPFGVLPYKALNGYGRVMDFKKGSYWHQFTANTKTLENSTIQFDIESDGNVLVRIRESNSGYLGLRKRNRIVGRDLDDYLEKLESEFDESGNLIIEDYKVINDEDLEKPITETFKLKYADKFSEDRIFINPFITSKYQKSPFNLKERTYPVDFGYPFSYKYKIVINLGDTYTVEDIPKSKALKLENNAGLLNYQVTKTDNQVLLSLNFTINTSYFASEDYNALKKIFSELVFMQNNQLIHIKKVK